MNYAALCFCPVCTVLIGLPNFPTDAHNPVVRCPLCVSKQLVFDVKPDGLPALGVPPAETAALLRDVLIPLQFIPKSPELAMLRFYKQQIILQKSFFVKKREYEQLAKIRDVEIKLKAQIIDLAKAEDIDPTSVSEDVYDDKPLGNGALFGGPTPKHPPVGSQTLLVEWERRTAPEHSEAYRLARTRFLAHLRLLQPFLDARVDANVGVADIRNLLRQSSSLRVGSARSSGPDRVTQVAAVALESCQQHSLGPATSQPASFMLLCFVSSPSAEMEMMELTTITEHLQLHIGKQAEAVVGQTLDNDFGEELQLCVLLGYGPPRVPKVATVQ